MIIKKTKNFSIIFLLTVIGLFLPLKFAWALGWLAGAIATAVVNRIFGMWVMLSIFWLELCEGLMRFVLSPNFVNVPYTTNAFVTLGWGITRDFANLFFIVILVIIGLTTALRIRDYEWQKTLPRLILIALLINFTPVLLGLIIDATNIFMNFFVEGIAKEVFFVSQAQLYLSNVFDITQKTDWVEAIITPIFFIGFNFIAGVMYLLFAVIFIFRYIALWALIILSPIAFICYVLPGTKQLFSMWWKQFIQWCLIGVFATFFLYLADSLLVMVISDPGFIGEGQREGWGIINSLMPFSVVIGFLFIGFFVSVSFAPAGTNALFSFAQKQIKSGVSFAGKKYSGKVKDWGRETITKSEKVQRLAQKMAEMKTPGENMRGDGTIRGARRAVGGALVRSVSRPFVDPLRAAGKAVGSDRIENQRAIITAGEKELAGQRPEAQLSTYRNAQTEAQRIFALNAAVKDNNFDDLMNRGLTDDEVKRTLKVAEKYDAHRDISSARPSLTENAEEAVQKTRPHRAGQISERELKVNETMEAIVQNWDGRHMAKFIESHGREGVGAIESAIKRLADNEDGLKTVNQQLLQFLKNSAGQRLGFDIQNLWSGQQTPAPGITPRTPSETPSETGPGIGGGTRTGTGGDTGTKTGGGTETKTGGDTGTGT